MDSNQAIQEILTLSSMNEQYLQQMTDINSDISIDDINDNFTLNKNLNMERDAGDVGEVMSKVKNISILQKKILDNIATMNSLAAGIQLDPTYFDDLVSLAKYNSTFVTDNIPDASSQNEVISINVQYKNSGFSPWDTTVILKVTIKDGGDGSLYNTSYNLLNSANNTDIGDTAVFSGQVQMPSTTGSYVITGTLQQNNIDFGDLFTEYIYIG